MAKQLELFRATKPAVTAGKPSATIRAGNYSRETLASFLLPEQISPPPPEKKTPAEIFAEEKYQAKKSSRKKAVRRAPADRDDQAGHATAEVAGCAPPRIKHIY
jgi:hypothetical protein